MNQKEQLKEFGEKLKKLREANDISLAHIFEITRNDLKYLQAIEEGNFDIMPDVYMKALLKEYAEAIGLNSGEIVAEFSAIKEEKTEEKQEIPQTNETTAEESTTKVFEETSFGLNPETDGGIKSGMFSGNNKIIIVLLGLAVVVLAYFVFKPEPPKEIVKETPYKEIIKSRTEESSAGNQVPQGSKSKPAAAEVKTKKLGALTLVIEGTDTSWVRITADGKLQGEFLIYPGVKKSFGAGKYFTVLAGNSGGVNLYLNDSTLTFSGRKGRVRNLYIDKNGVKYLKISKKKKNE